MDCPIQKFYNKAAIVNSKCVFEIENFQNCEIHDKIKSAKVHCFELDIEWTAEIFSYEDRHTYPSTCFSIQIDVSAATVAKRLKYRIFGTSQSAGVEPVIIIQPKVFQNVDKVEICDKTYVTHTNLKRFITPDGLLTVTLHVEFQSTGNSIVFQQRQQKSMLQFIDQGSNLLNDATFSDFTFIVKSKTFKVHKNILANESETMRAMFTNELKESVEGQCVVDDIEPDVFHNMLEFIYAGMISANLEDVAIDLYKAAHYYRIVKLMDICKECIHSRLTNDNSMDVYELATMYEMEDVRMDAWKIVKSQCFKIYFPLNNESLSLKEFREIRDLITKQADFWSNHKKTD